MALEIVEILISILIMVLLFILLRKVGSTDPNAITYKLEDLKKDQERLEQRLLMEFATNREELARLSKDQRLELSEGILKMGDQTIGVLRSMEQKIELSRNSVDTNLKNLYEQNERQLSDIRKTVDETLLTLLDKQRQEQTTAFSKLREETISTLKQISDTILATLKELARNQQDQLSNFASAMKELTGSMENRLETLRTTVDGKLKDIQENNSRQLEEIRKNVNERLSETLEKRLGESFKLVSERLEAVHKGLGEMQNLATQVGSLQRVLSNVKARGTWAEIQLEALIEQVLTPEQYGKNVQLRPNSQERVEFAIKLPGPKEDRSQVVWLPIDAKFPQEDYLRLQDAVEKGDPELFSRAVESLKRTALQFAKEIGEKYIHPPYTTDFAVMYLATEGLYAELLRQPGLVEEMQIKYRVTPSGPTTLHAILSGLRMGFHTLAIEQRASEVWRLLGAVKTEFRKFGETLDKVKKHLDSASKTLEDTGTRTRAMERKLRSVEEIPAHEAEKILGIEA